MRVLGGLRLRRLATGCRGEWRQRRQRRRFELRRSFVLVQGNVRPAWANPKDVVAGAGPAGDHIVTVGHWSPVHPWADWLTEPPRRSGFVRIFDADGGSVVFSEVVGSSDLLVLEATAADASDFVYGGTFMGEADLQVGPREDRWSAPNVACFIGKAPLP